MTYASQVQGNALSSADLASAIATADFSGRAATVIGYGNMGRQYVKALRALEMRRIRVCSRSDGPLTELHNVPGTEPVAGGFERLQCSPLPGELGIVATPTDTLVAGARRLASLGFRNLLIEKPISLYSTEIEQLAEDMEKTGVTAFCAYNRVAYPSFHEVLARISGESGITSCTYTFTELIKPDWPQRFPAEELERWGVANSLHVISMAHALIGLPDYWSGHRSGSLPWHPAGAVFTGSGISDLGIPFCYHADWGSTGRWSVEVHTSISSYRFSPLEKLLRRMSALADWEEVPITAFSPAVKVGFVEQLAASLSAEIRQHVPLITLRQAAAVTAYGEKVFGYLPK